jgi:hypothetical protein
MLRAILAINGLQAGSDHVLKMVTYWVKIYCGSHSVRVREEHAGCDINMWEVCEISSSHGGEYDVQSCLLGCTAV